MPPKRDAGGSCRTVADVQAKLDTQAGRTGAPAPPPAAAGSPPPLPPAARRLPLVGTQASAPTALQVQQLETLLSTGEKKVKNLGLSFSNSIFKRAQASREGRRAAARGLGWKGCYGACNSSGCREGGAAQLRPACLSLFKWCCVVPHGPMQEAFEKCEQINQVQRASWCCIRLQGSCPPSCPTTYSSGMACFVSGTRPCAADACSPVPLHAPFDNTHLRPYQYPPAVRRRATRCGTRRPPTTRRRRRSLQRASRWKR